MAPVAVGAVTDSPKIFASGNPGGFSADYEKSKHVANFICDIVFSGRLFTRNEPLLNGPIVGCPNGSILVDPKTG